MTELRVVTCPHCPEAFHDSERYSAEDYLSDHITDAHQDVLRNVHEGAYSA